MPVFHFAVFEVDSSYYYTDAQSLILSKDTLAITDGVDDDLHRTVDSDPNNDQSFSFASEAPVTNYTVQYLDYAQINGAGPDFELYAMRADFSDGTTKFYVMSKDDGFEPDINDDLKVTMFSNFTVTSYGQIGAAVCYAAGTKILTSTGLQPVEHLNAGALVQTKDNGYREVLWVGRRHLGSDVLCACETLRPVVVQPGVLGNSCPVVLSQQHRVLLTRQQCGGDLPWEEAFIKAKHLAEYGNGVARIVHGRRSVWYYHLLLSEHDIIFADGLASESLFLGRMALNGIDRADRAEIDVLFPGVLGQVGSGARAGLELARPEIPRKLLRGGILDDHDLATGYGALARGMSGPDLVRHGVGF